MVYFGCRKRFLCPDAVINYCEWAKNISCVKETAKNKTVYFGCRKRFLCPEAVINYCEWAKKRFLRRKKPFFSLSWILL